MDIEQMEDLAERLESALSHLSESTQEQSVWNRLVLFHYQELFTNSDLRSGAAMTKAVEMAGFAMKNYRTFEEHLTE